MSDGSSGSGPCGACKFLRRKCVKGCIFAPYFDSDQGTAQFAAVHKVFGASNASKLLLRIPPHKRLDTAVTLCYEALARSRDPVYGCVGHIFTLQQQVVNLQAELAYTQARLSTLQCLPPPLPLMPPQRLQRPYPTSLQYSSSDLPFNTSTNAAMMQYDPYQSHQMSSEMTSICESINQELEDDDGDDLQALAREFVARYMPAGARFRPPPANPH